MESFTIEQLELAFAYQLVNRILGADGQVVPAEARFLERTFPAELLSEAGFTDDHGAFTDRFREALGEALLRLPGEIDEDRRLDLVGTLLGAARSDGVLDADESAAVDHAARLLNLTPEQVTARLER